MSNPFALNAQPNSNYEPVASFEDGPQAFAHLFSNWMDTNHWSHPVLCQLAKCSLNKVSWLHGSTVANLRRGQTRNPGPRCFIAIERLNYYLWRYADSGRLIPNTTSSRDYSKAAPILDQDQPPPLGWFLEVFSGVRHLPHANARVFVPVGKLSRTNRLLANLLRTLIQRRGDLFESTPILLAQHWPGRSRRDGEAIKDLILTNKPIGAEQLSCMLPLIAAFCGAIGGPSSVQDLCKVLLL